MLFLVIFIFKRRYVYIYPAGLLGCLIAGWINGFGSLFYYSALGRINAGLGQLLYSLYPLFLLLWMALDNQPPSRLTVFRLILVVPALLLLIDRSGGGQIDLIGVVEMLVASALYALHLPFNQRVLYDMPAPTVTLYTLLAMSALVVPVYLFSGAFTVSDMAEAANNGQLLQSTRPFWGPVLGLSLVTFLSRLMLFQGVKQLGGMQTALLGLSELLVTVFFAHWWLEESFTTQQWLGAALLVTSLMLVGLEKPPPRRQGKGGFLSWMGSTRLPGETFQPFD
jgi:drug/metabolite transporter (DMT)-like permease